MSEAKGQDNKWPNSEGVGPTRSFDGSTPGPGSQIGPFRIERELGRGGMGVVYLAHDTKLDRPVAIKSLPAEAVAAAHEHDVIHRDLKPGNIKITPEGKVKVLDFGLAKAVGGETVDQQSTVTEPGRVIGTPAYMSPEQAREKATSDLNILVRGMKFYMH